MEFTSHLPTGLREHAERRLRENIVGWFTSVRPSGQPDCVPVGFVVQDDDTILVYSQPGKTKLRNIAANPRVTLTLDETAASTDVIRIEGTAKHVPGHPPAPEVAAHVAKYGEYIASSGFGTLEWFAEVFSEAIVITPTRLHAFTRG
ncbi:pyridoxamine 5'-phosphate oxidase family protein [Amycolatopsis anabasis]|uniref:pyridoxamine 5'-phosphate oxidase family protein n=1 Tax=Amycolatopsis anabasis TaxID=1840409 RepID=UPI00131D1193|nr:pyridoxamine 5'-phosphate oxidase family protein [Amycolatopsis anabasis]